jgi:predicted RNase H-like HicB family nuclease
VENQRTPNPATPETLSFLFLHHVQVSPMASVTLSAVLNPQDSGYVALCPELDIASQGESLDEALANLKEAVEGFFEAASSSEIEARLKARPALFTHLEVTRA